MITRKAFLVSCLILLASNLSLAGENVCRIGKFQYHGNGVASVGVILLNSDTIAGFQVPLRFDFGEDDITCDSVSFAGGRCEDFSFLHHDVTPEEKRVFLCGSYTTVPEETIEPLYPGRGEIARIFFTAQGVPQSKRIKVYRSHHQLTQSKLDYLFYTPDGREVRCRLEVKPFRFKTQQL